MKPSIATKTSLPSIQLGGDTFAITEFWDSGLLWDNGGFWDVGSGFGLPTLLISNQKNSISVSSLDITIGVNSSKPSGTVT